AEIREAEVARARAAVVAARARHDRPLHLQTDLAGAEAALARARTEQSLLPAQVRSAEVQLRTARRTFESLQNASDAVPAIRIRKAGDEVDAAVAFLEGLRARQKFLPTEVSALERKCKALTESLERKTDEARHLAESEAALRIAAGKQKQAQS